MSPGWQIAGALVGGLVGALLAEVYWPPESTPKLSDYRSITCPDVKGAILSMSLTHVDEHYVKCVYVMARPNATK